MELLSPLFEARAEYLAAAFETIDATWGGTERYLTDGLRLTPSSATSCTAACWTEPGAHCALLPTSKSR